MYNNWVAISIISGLRHLKLLVEHSPTQTQLSLNVVISITTYIFGCSRFVCKLRLLFLFVTRCFGATAHPWLLHCWPARNNSRLSVQMPVAAETARNLVININQLDALNFIISLFQVSTCFEHMCSSSGGQNCTIQSLVSSYL